MDYKKSVNGYNQSGAILIHGMKPDGSQTTNTGTTSQSADRPETDAGWLGDSG